MFHFLTRKQWFLFDADKGAEGGESSDDDVDKNEADETDDDFLDISKKKEGIADTTEEGLSASLSKKKDVKDKGDDTSTGERPSNIPEKFWDVEKKEIRLDTLLDSYKERESALSRLRAENKVPEFPEEYLDVFTFDNAGQIRYSEGVDHLPTISKDDPLFVGALESFHRRGLSTEQVAGVIKDVFKVMDGIYPEPFDNDAYVAEQNELLGVNFEMQTQTAISWVESLHTQGTLNLKEAQALHRDVARSAHGVMALNKIRAEVTGEAVIPVHEVVPEDGIPTEEEWYAMKLSEDYGKDVQFKKKVDDLLPYVFPGTGQADLRGKGMASIQANDARRRKKNLGA